MRIKKQSENIEDYKLEDFGLVGYNPHKTLKMEMAICCVCLNQMVCMNQDFYDVFVFFIIATIELISHRFSKQ